MAVRRHGETGPAFPSWSKFLQQGADALEEETLVTNAETVRRLIAENPPGYVQAAQLVYDGLQRRGWARLLRKHFLLEHATIDPITLGTAQALWKLSPQAIITSNFDFVLRWACPRHHDLREWGLDDPHGYVELLEGELDSPAVWHLHGTILRPHEVVLTFDDYRDLYGPEGKKNWEQALLTLRMLLATRTFLFVGFSFADEYFKGQVEYIKNLFHGAGRSHYVLVREAEREVTQERLAGLPVRFVPYEDHGEPLIHVLEDLASFRGDRVSGGGTPTAPGAGSLGSGSPTSAGGVGVHEASVTAKIGQSGRVGAAPADEMGFTLVADRFRAEGDALILLGKWSPGCDGDRKATAGLGVDAMALERACADLAHLDPPLARLETEYGGRSHWTWTRPKEAWRRLLPSVPSSILDRFVTLAITVLSERDPSLEMPPDERYLAPVQGKRWRFSAALREGIATNLVRLSESDDLLRRTHGTSRGSLAAHVVVRGILPTEWQAWASLNAILPYLAEAAPATFLDQVDASLGAGPSGVAQLLRQESQLGRAWHTGLLWALETLGWRPELMSRVAVALARLAHHDPGGNLANRPMRSLENLLHPFMPQSRSSGPERMRILRTVAARVPDVAWRAGLELFSSGGFMSPSRRPQIAQWKLPPDTGDIATDVFEQTSGLLRFLVDSCSADPARWSAVLALVLRMNHEDAGHVLGAFATVTDAALRDTAQAIWATLRELLHNAYEFREAWQVADDVLLQLEEQYRRLTPEDPVARIAWLFSARVLLPEATSGWEQECAKIAERQAEAIAELWKREDRWQRLTELAATVEAPNWLGDALGQASYAEEVEHTLLTSPDPSLARLLPSFAARRYHQRGASWLDGALRALISGGRRNDALAVLVSIRPEPALWDLIEQSAPDLRLEYWKAVGAIFGPLSAVEWSRAIRALLQAERPAQALETASHADRDLEPTTALEVLRALASAPAAELRLLAAGGSGSYHLERVFSALDRSTDAVPLEQRIGLELAFLEFLERSRMTLHLFETLEQSPELFAELITARYRPDEEASTAASPHPTRSSDPTLAENTGDPTDVERQQRAAANSFRVLHAWRGYPGRNQPAEIANEVALRWCERALDLTRAAHRQRMGAYEVGCVMARLPAAADGLWPAPAARELLKRTDGTEIADGLYIGKRNSRGVFSRKFGEGGDQEHELAAAFREHAEALRTEWPEAAAVDDRLSSAYAHDAQEQDDIAQSDRRRYAAGDEDEEDR